MEHFK